MGIMHITKWYRYITCVLDLSAVDFINVINLQ